MKDINKLLTIVLLIIALLLLYLVFTGSRQLKETHKIIKEVNREIVQVKDSISYARNTIIGIGEKLEFTENELKILKAERQLLELEEKKSKARNWEELTTFKKEITELEEKKMILKEEAKKFEL
ncbi:MAG: hypothetical protein JXJ22_04695 [Bacteroidales bacterium]|nr:hypothetical protein [Bacteroidales bacterium]